MHRFLAAFLACLLATPLARASDGEVRNAQDLLEALEHADDDLRTLTALVSYDRRFALQGDRHVRRGRLYFRNRDDEAPRAFAFHFDKLWVGGRQTDDRQTWIFDGRWLTEVRPDAKRYHARELAPRDATIDPLRVGEGPLPIPIGQVAEEVLARYDAQLVASGDGLAPGEAAGVSSLLDRTWQLRLTPREAHAEDDEFREIRIWYDRRTLVPRMSKTVNRRGDEAFVVLISVERNLEDFDEAKLVADRPPEGSGWEVQIDELTRGG